MTDNFGRIINYARISLTDRCNLRCKYCMPTGGIDKKECDDMMRFEQIEMLVEALVQLGVQKIRFTGGEPFVRKGIQPFLQKIMPQFKQVQWHITTNGMFLYDNVEALKMAGLTGLNISIDTLDKEKYRNVTRGGNVDKVIKGIEKAIAVGVPKIKLNAVLTKDLTPKEIKDLAQYTMDYPIDVRFIELMPIGDCADYAKANYVSDDILFRALPQLQPVEKEDAASPADYFQIPGAKGKIGMIRPISCKFCANCNRIRITADGKLKHCLHSDEEFDLIPVMHSIPAIQQVILSAIGEKPKEHHLDTHHITRNMKRIGG